MSLQIFKIDLLFCLFVQDVFAAKRTKLL